MKESKWIVTHLSRGERCVGGSEWQGAERKDPRSLPPVHCGPKERNWCQKPVWFHLWHTSRVDFDVPYYSLKSSSNKSRVRTDESTTFESENSLGEGSDELTLCLTWHKTTHKLSSLNKRSSTTGWRTTNSHLYVFIGLMSTQYITVVLLDCEDCYCLLIKQCLYS